MLNMELSQHCFLWQVVKVLRQIKRKKKYEKAQTLIRCKLPFPILRLVLLCIKLSRSISEDSVVVFDVFLNVLPQACFRLEFFKIWT